MSDTTEEVHTLLRELVAIPSHEDETATGDRIERWLRAHTDATVRRDDAPGGGNVIARRGSGGPAIAFVGHHDVVPPAPEQQAEDGGYRVEKRDGRLYGRGTADMLGAVAAGLGAFRDATPKTELIFASFVGEEAGGVGARYAINQGFTPAFAIVGEGSASYATPGALDVVVAHKGRRASTVSVAGDPTHAGVPETGTNAIYGACDAIETLREQTPSTYTITGETLKGTVAVTEIDGGEAWNQIPGHCELTVDERTVPAGVSPLERLEDRPDITVTVEQDLPPMACSTPAFADAVEAAANATQPETPRQTVKPHATDAGWLADAGSACVVCGPAELGEAHTADESVSLDLVDRSYRLYRKALSMAPPSPGDSCA